LTSQSQNKMSSKEEKLLVILVSICLFFIGIHRGGSQLIVSDVALLFGLGEGGVGTLGALRHIPPFIAPLIAGIIADKVGKKPIVVISTFVFAIGCAICGFSTSLPIMIIGVLVFSTGSSVSEMVATAALTDANEDKSFQYINISQFLFSMGAFLGPLILEYYREKEMVDWRFPFSVGFITFLVCGLGYLIIKFPANPTSNNSKSIENNETVFTKLRDIFSFITPVIIVLAIVMFLYIGMESGYGGFISSVMKSKNGTSAVAAFALSAFWGGTAISRLIFGFISYKPKRTLRRCLLISAVLLVTISVIPAGTFSVILSGLIGFTYGPIWGTLEAVAATSAGGKSASAIGLMSMAGGFGGIIIPALMGKLVGPIPMNYILIVLAVSAVIGALMWLLMKGHDEVK